jgi:hypothetical protein
MKTKKEIEEMRKTLRQIGAIETEIMLRITDDEADASITEMTDKDGRDWRRVGRHVWTARRVDGNP